MAKAPLKTHLRSSKIRLGVVGGGQLARMLALASAPLGAEVHILSEKESDPAAQVVRHWHQGEPHSRKDVIEFCQELDFLTFESEFFDMAAFIEAQQNNLLIFPSPAVMQTLQNRNSQKTSLVKNKISTAKFVAVENREDLHSAWKEFPKGFVLKKCRGGYDGFGTFYCRSKKDLEKLQSLFPESFIAEELISFRRELAFTLVRDRKGNIVSLPLVESKQTESRCDWVIGPVHHPQFAKLEKQICTYLQNLAYVGAISFEIFDTGTRLIINEVAPRVHNSAHYSQNALSHSQFLLHVMAGLGIQLPQPKFATKAFCMVNLVGQSHLPAQFPENLSGELHWYGKLENRPGRKMGHVNYLGSSSKALLKTALQERKKFIL